MFGQKSAGFFKYTQKTLTQGGRSSVKKVCIRTSSSILNENNVWRSKSIIDIPKIPLHQCIFDGIEKHAGNTYMVDAETGANYTFSQTRELSQRLASALSRIGIAKGDVLALISPNCPEFIITVLASITIGVTVTPVSPYYTPNEVSYHLRDSESNVVICHEDCLQNTKEALKNLPRLKLLVVIGKDHGVDDAKSFRKLLADDGKGIPNNIQLDLLEDTVMLPYSSGTSGVPKGVMLNHVNLVSNTYQYGNASFLSGSVSLVRMAALPMYHVAGFLNCFPVACFLGSKIIIMKKYDTANYVRLLDQHQVTTTTMVPPILAAICNDPIATPQKLSSLKIVSCGAAPVVETLKEKFVEKFGKTIELLDGYGMTEMTTICYFSSYNESKTDESKSHITPNTAIKIVDLETGDILGSDLKGELCIKGPQVMKGYWKNPEATKRTVRDGGWLHTGDIAKIDNKGNISIIDRVKELIKVKGFQVPPAELEDLILRHPSVADVTVIGVPDEQCGEVPKAFVVPSSGASTTEDEIIEFVQGKVAPYKRLKGGVEFIDRIPKNPSGKILRKVLRNRNEIQIRKEQNA